MTLIRIRNVDEADLLLNREGSFAFKCEMQEGRTWKKLGVLSYSPTEHELRALRLKVIFILIFTLYIAHCTRWMKQKYAILRNKQVKYLVQVPASMSKEQTDIIQSRFGYQSHKPLPAPTPLLLPLPLPMPMPLPLPLPKIKETPTEIDLVPMQQYAHMHHKPKPTIQELQDRITQANNDPTNLVQFFAFVRLQVLLNKRELPHKPIQIEYKPSLTSEMWGLPEFFQQNKKESAPDIEGYVNKILADPKHDLAEAFKLPVRRDILKELKKLPETEDLKTLIPLLEKLDDEPDVDIDSILKTIDIKLNQLEGTNLHCLALDLGWTCRNHTLSPGVIERQQNQNNPKLRAALNGLPREMPPLPINVQFIEETFKLTNPFKEYRLKRFLLGIDAGLQQVLKAV